MPSIQVRPAVNTDLPALTALDHGYSTDYVWQMTAREEEASSETVITFRTARLPRSVRVSPVREPNRLAEAWKKRVCFLVAEEEGHLKGYVNLAVAAIPEVGWVADLCVDRRCRRTGVGTVLLASAAHWARENRLARLVLEMGSKNYPAICFALKNGLVFCGYNDRYYPQQEVALFFGMTLK
jgi:GNAT superfamily N-acetyltransferase